MLKISETVFLSQSIYFEIKLHAEADDSGTRFVPQKYKQKHILHPHKRACEILLNLTSFTADATKIFWNL